MLKQALATAVAMGLALPAFGLIPISVDPVNGVTPELEIRIGGATASDNSIQNLLTGTPTVSGICAPGTAHVFLSNESSAGASNRAVFCDIPATSLPGGAWPDGALSKRVLVRKLSSGGSANGVQPVCETLARGYMVLNNACTVSSGTTYTCPAATVEQLIPHVGVSDVGPREVQAQASGACGPNVKGSFALVFGMPVSVELYEALQAAQGLTVNPAGVTRDPVTGAVVGGQLGVNADPDNVPTLSKAQVRSLFSGRIKNWSQFKVGGTTLAAAPGVVAPSDAGTGAQAGGADNVTVCRRVDTSGTFASYALNIMGRTCLAGALNFATNQSAGPAVALASGSGNVEVCFDRLDRRVNLVTADMGTGGSIPFGFRPSTWAIGMQTTERNGDNSHAYQFVRLDGNLSTLNNAANGTYDFVLVSTIQHATSTPYNAGQVLDPAVSGGTGGAFRPTFAVVDLFADAITAAANPGDIAGSNSTAEFVHDWGNGGALALGENFPVDPDNDELWELENPVWPYTRAPSGALDNCLGPYLLNNGETQLSPVGDNAIN